MNKRETREHYEGLARGERPEGRLGCGFEDRYDPAAMASAAEVISRIGVVLDHCLSGYDGPRESALDAGCGTFFYHALLEDRFKTVAGVDSACAMVKAGAVASGGRGRASLVCGEAEHLPFASDSFDCVLGFDVIHHLEQPSLFMGEALRVLAPGGIYIGIEPNMLNPGMFAAHLLPAEERGALRWNFPGRMRKLVGEFFERPRIGFFNLSISAQYSGGANTLFPWRAEGSPFWGLRMAICGRKKP